MFSPPLIRTDLLKVREQIQALNLYADSYHVDIMDGHFIKNITLSPGFAKTVVRVNRVLLDCHLMATHPDDYITMLAQAGTTFLSPYAETINTDAFRILHKIHEFGCRTGIVLNPAIPLSYIRYYLHLLNKATIMSVDPGSVEQVFIREVPDKIKEAKVLKLQHDYRCLIGMDGSCNATAFQELRQTGMEIFIVGSSGLFQLDDNLHAAQEKVLAQFHEEIDKAQYL